MQQTIRQDELCYRTAMIPGHWQLLGVLRRGTKILRVAKKFDGVNPVTLTQRLQKLEIERVIRVRDADKISVVYGLTRGRPSFPSLNSWESMQKSFVTELPNWI